VNINSILSFAKAAGYADVKPTDSWNGYDVYRPVESCEHPRDSGLPVVILVKGDEIRMSTDEEAFERLDDWIHRHEQVAMA